MIFSGGTVKFGTAATVDELRLPRAGKTPNVVVDNTTNEKTLILSGQLNVWGNLTINSGHDRST